MCAGRMAIRLFSFPQAEPPAHFSHEDDWEYHEADKIRPRARTCKGFAMSRWFRVAADIFEHEFFAQSEMSEREAFLWLVAKAAWKDTRHRVGAEMLPVPRGSLFVTLREICAAWGWKSDFRVRTFLDAMEAEGMIKRTANAGKTCVSICNYDRYQTPSAEDKRNINEPETHGKRTENALKIPVYQDTKEYTSLRSVAPQGGLPKKSKIEIEEIEGVSKSLLADWKAVRKAKRAGPVTKSALEALQREADKANISVAYAVQLCAERGWQSFQADYKFTKPDSGAGPVVTSQVFLTPADPEWNDWVEYRRKIGAPKPAAVSTHNEMRGSWFPSKQPPQARA